MFLQEGFFSLFHGIYLTNFRVFSFSGFVRKLFFQALLVFLLAAGFVFFGCLGEKEGSGSFSSAGQGVFEENHSQDFQKGVFRNGTRGFGWRNDSFRNSSGRPNFTRGFGEIGNLSEEQRRELFEKRFQEAVDACAGRNQGDSCFVSSPRGVLNGSCVSREGKLLCVLKRDFP